MSGFKRMQSKVFWGHMESQDVDNSPLLFSNNDSLILPKIHQNSYCNFGHDSDTDNDENTNDCINNVKICTTNILGYEKTVRTVDEISSSGGATLGNENHCATHVRPHEGTEKKNDQTAMPVICNENLVEVIPRTFSSFDQGHGSLDSGFSDSEGLKSPETTNNIDKIGTRRRQRRRRRSRDKRDGMKMNIHNGQSNLSWIDNDLPPCPSHTSTPKRDIQDATGCLNMHCGEHTVAGQSNEDGRINRRIDEEQAGTTVELSPEFIYAFGKEEYFDDFLYCNEPPEEYDVPTTSSCSTSRGSTPSFSGPWYTRVSTESSSKFPCGSTIQRQRTIFRKKIYSSVKMWLTDLMLDVEDDCCITLQSKALPKRKPPREINKVEQTRDLKMMTAKATASATELLVRAENFTTNIRDAVAKISYRKSGRSQRDFLRPIEEEAFSILSELGAPPPRRIHEGSLRSVLHQIESLKNMVECTLDTRLDFYITRVVRGLEDAPRETGSVARGALAALTALGLAGARAGNSIARCSGVRALLTSLISASRLSSELRASTLRALTSVCCCPSAINYFVKDGGPEILMDLLTSKSTPESEKMEATALVVQITAPWTDALGLTHLEPFADILINVLTCLADETTCCQTLLLCAAALNNLSDSPICTQCIVQYDGIRRLLRCVKKSSGTNIWLMEQVASLINKLAKNSDIRRYLAQARASVALVSFLRMAPPGLEDAYQRLSVIAATALTRLCVNEEIAKQVVAVGGADCLPNRHLYDNDDDDIQLGVLKYSKSLRVACKRAAKHIDDAKACDYTI